MNVIQEFTSQTSAGTSATATAIGKLAHMALDLHESVAGFKLPEEIAHPNLLEEMDDEMPIAADRAETESVDAVGEEDIDDMSLSLDESLLADGDHEEEIDLPLNEDENSEVRA